MPPLAVVWGVIGNDWGNRSASGQELSAGVGLELRADEADE